jgi:hypothetical protein
MVPRRKKQKCTTIVVESSSSVVAEVPVVVFEQVFTNVDIVQNIVSFIGEYQYLFVASINTTFRQVYIKLYPNKKVTYFNGLTMKHLKLCYNNKLSFHQRHALIQSVARHGNIEGLRYLRTKKIYTTLKLDTRTIESIVENTYLHLLKWAHSIRAAVKWSYMIEFASKYGNMILLEWLYNQYTSKFNQTACQGAAYGGQLYTLQWLRQRDVAWDEQVCSNAAVNNHFEVLKWAHTNGCRWDKYVCINAARNGKQ